MRSKSVEMTLERKAGRLKLDHYITHRFQGVEGQKPGLCAVFLLGSLDPGYWTPEVHVVPGVELCKLCLGPVRQEAILLAEVLSFEGEGLRPAGTCMSLSSMDRQASVSWTEPHARSHTTAMALFPSVLCYGWARFRSGNIKAIDALHSGECLRAAGLPACLQALGVAACREFVHPSSSSRCAGAGSASGLL